MPDCQAKGLHVQLFADPSSRAATHSALVSIATNSSATVLHPSIVLDASTCPYAFEVDLVGMKWYMA